MREQTDLLSLGAERDRLDDVRIATARPLISPAILLEEIERSELSAHTVLDARRAICDIAFGNDPRILAIVGPCSIHAPYAAMEYAQRLKILSERFREKIYVVMRSYFEKPRTVGGWEGFITDPYLDGSHRINQGLREARRLLREFAEMGLPTATEFLDMTVPQYISDLIAWSAIGARTSESQPHRKLASGLSMPVGFKNPTDGRIQPAVDAILSARRSHWFPGATKDGVAAHFRTTGNEHTHVVLRGGTRGPNFDAEHVEDAVRRLTEADLTPRVMVDCSHANSGKDHRKQIVALQSVADQLSDGSRAIFGVMIESNIVAGRQEVAPGKELNYGQSITDACVDLAETERMFEILSKAI